MKKARPWILIGCLVAVACGALVVSQMHLAYGVLVFVLGTVTAVVAARVKNPARRKHRRIALLIALALMLGPATSFLLRYQACVEAREAQERATAMLQAEQRAAAERARVEAEKARQAELDRFNAMTPAAHVEVAKTALAAGYDAETKTGGDLERATKHLAAVPEAAAEKAEASKLLAEIDGRVERAQKIAGRDSLRLARKAMEDGDLRAARSHLSKIPPDDRSFGRQASSLLKQVERQEQRELDATAKGLRDGFAERVDRTFIEQGLEVQSVRATGTKGTTLTINYALCGRVFMDRFMTADMSRILRGLGFTKAECRSYFDNVWYDL